MTGSILREVSTARALRSLSRARTVHSQTSVFVLCELIAAPFEGSPQTLLLSDLREFDADVRSCRIERRQHVEPGMHGIGEAHGVGAAIYGQLGMGERFR